MRLIYLLLTLIGTALPLLFLIPWLLENSLNIPFLLEQAMANPISMLAWVDVIIAALALIIFIVIDGARHQVKGRIWALLGTCCVGVSCGLPLYLYLKQVKSEKGLFR